MKKQVIISHIRKSDQTLQSNEDHSKGVAVWAERFTREIGMPGWGHFLGELHDKGKEKHDFQTYIRIMNDIPTETGNYQDKTHAYVGALLAHKLFPKGYPFVAYALAGHHAGMPDFLSLKECLKKPLPAEISLEGLPESPDIPATLLKAMRGKPYMLNHLLRMLYSCLVDADYLDTECFMQQDMARLRGSKTNLNELLHRLETHLAQLAEQSPDTPVNQIRKQVQDACRKSAEGPIGIYSLTVPTGGGKTLSSVLWALLHAVKHGKKRIILSIPYTSIITQTATVLRAIFGEENVLEHHSNLQLNEQVADEESALRKKLATENWDFPIIVTTNVQLLESMYASHPAACRKLHHIAHSVILFDEAQTLPAERLQPIVDALQTYHRLFDVSLLFTTASQPTLEGIREGHTEQLQGFDKIEEIIPVSWKLHERLKRVRLHFRKEAINYEAIANDLMLQHRVLCIVNTRKDAGEIFSRLNAPKEGAFHFHLSRMMCSEHLDKTLQKIKETLKQNNSTPVRVVSTQLVEAGVDMDFPVVYRQEAGLDSILQAAGRCNREGRLPKLGHTEVFRLEGRPVPPGTLSFANQARLNMAVPNDWFAPQAMTDYFTHFYHLIPTFDRKDKDKEGVLWSMKQLLYKPQELMFDTADQIFQLIDNKGYSVVMPYNESIELRKRLEQGELNATLFRKLNRFTVQLTERDLKVFLSAGMIEPIHGLYFLIDSAQYDEKVGLKWNNHWMNETLIV